MRRARRRLWSALLLVSLPGWADGAALEAGDIVVSTGASFPHDGALWRVDPQTGAYALLLDGMGGLEDPKAVAVDRDRTVVVAQSPTRPGDAVPELIRFDPETGQLEVLSATPATGAAVGLEALPSGEILLGRARAIESFDPLTASFQLLHSLSADSFLTDLTVSSEGDVLFGVAFFPNPPSGHVSRLEPSGAVTTLAPIPTARLASESPAGLLAIFRNQLVRLDVATGGLGFPFVPSLDPVVDVAARAPGEIYVVHPTSFRGSAIVDSVDPVGGGRTFVAAIPAGPDAVSRARLALVPSPQSVAVALARRGRGLVHVTVYGSEDFDASRIAADTLAFEPEPMPWAMRGAPRIRDADGDGFDGLTVGFGASSPLAHAGLYVGGETLDGAYFAGCAPDPASGANSD